jgi:uncharacterized protein YciI
MRNSILAVLTLLFIVTAPGVNIGKSEPVPSPYVVGVRRKGPTWKADLNTPEGRRMIQAHGEVIRKMVATGKLIAAGPFGDPADLRGLLLFRDCTIEEARRMASEDPVVKSGQITIEYHTWMAKQKLKPAE